MRARCILIAGLFVMVGRAEIVDRIAIIVDNQAIKHSDILNEIRETAFLNNEKLDFSIDEQKKAANRLIDQALIRKDIQAGNYAMADPALAEQLLRQIKQRYPNEAAFRQALARSGITEDMLKQHLEWQTQVLKFVELRFGGGQIASGGASGAQIDGVARVASNGATNGPAANSGAANSGAANNGPANSAAGNDVNQQFFKWLDETRKHTRIVFKEENLK